MSSPVALYDARHFAASTSQGACFNRWLNIYRGSSVVNMCAEYSSAQQVQNATTMPLEAVAIVVWPTGGVRQEIVYR